MINANENPMGPCPEAADAIHSIIAKGGRYLYGETFKMDKILAEQEGVKPNYVMAFAGSSDPLHRAVLSYTSKDKPLIVGDPGYEAAARAANFIGAKVPTTPAGPSPAKKTSSTWWPTSRPDRLCCSMKLTSISPTHP